MAPGCPGISDTVVFSVLAIPEPHILLGITDIVPPAAPGVADIEVVVELPLHPDGNIQVYEVAPVTSEMLKICGIPSHTTVLPEITPG